MWSNERHSSMKISTAFSLLIFSGVLVFASVVYGETVQGTPGVDYPNYHSIPRTSFKCSDQRYIPGFYADLETQCQAFHFCFKDHKESFLCPTGTIFNQATLSCDDWFNSNCSLAPILYSVNAGPAIKGAGRKLPMLIKLRNRSQGKPSISTLNVFEKMPSLPEASAATTPSEEIEPPSFSGEINEVSSSNVSSGKSVETPPENSEAAEDIKEPFPNEALPEVEQNLKGASLEQEYEGHSGNMNELNEGMDADSLYDSVTGGYYLKYDPYRTEWQQDSEPASDEFRSYYDQENKEYEYGDMFQDKADSSGGIVEQLPEGLDFVRQEITDEETEFAKRQLLVEKLAKRLRKRPMYVVVEDEEDSMLPNESGEDEYLGDEPELTTSETEDSTEVPAGSTVASILTEEQRAEMLAQLQRYLQIEVTTERPLTDDEFRRLIRDEMVKHSIEELGEAQPDNEEQLLHDEPSELGTSDTEDSTEVPVGSSTETHASQKLRRLQFPRRDALPTKRPLTADQFRQLNHYELVQRHQDELADEAQSEELLLNDEPSELGTSDTEDSAEVPAGSSTETYVSQEELRRLQFPRSNVLPTKRPLTADQFRQLIHYELVLGHEDDELADEAQSDNEERLLNGESSKDALTDFLSEQSPSVRAAISGSSELDSSAYNFGTEADSEAIAKTREDSEVDSWSQDEMAESETSVDVDDTFVVIPEESDGVPDSSSIEDVDETGDGETVTEGYVYEEQPDDQRDDENQSEEYMYQDAYEYYKSHGAFPEGYETVGSAAYQGPEYDYARHYREQYIPEQFYDANRGYEQNMHYSSYTPEELAYLCSQVSDERCSYLQQGYQPTGYVDPNYGQESGYFPGDYSRNPYIGDRENQNYYESNENGEYYSQPESSWVHQDSSDDFEIENDVGVTDAPLPVHVTEADILDETSEYYVTDETNEYYAAPAKRWVRQDSSENFELGNEVGITDAPLPLDEADLLDSDEASVYYATDETNDYAEPGNPWVRQDNLELNQAGITDAPLPLDITEAHLLDSEEMAREGSEEEVEDWQDFASEEQDDEQNKDALYVFDFNEDNAENMDEIDDLQGNELESESKLDVDDPFSDANKSPYMTDYSDQLDIKEMLESSNLQSDHKSPSNDSIISSKDSETSSQFGRTDSKEASSFDAFSTSQDDAMSSDPSGNTGATLNMKPMTDNWSSFPTESPLDKPVTLSSALERLAALNTAKAQKTSGINLDFTNDPQFLSKMTFPESMDFGPYGYGSSVGQQYSMLEAMQPNNAVNQFSHRTGGGESEQGSFTKLTSIQEKLRSMKQGKFGVFKKYMRSMKNRK